MNIVTQSVTFTGDILIEVGLTNSGTKINIVQTRLPLYSLTPGRMFSSVKVKVIICNLDNPNSSVIEQQYSYYLTTKEYLEWLINKITVALEQFNFLHSASQSKINRQELIDYFTNHVEQEVYTLGGGE